MFCQRLITIAFCWVFYPTLSFAQEWEVPPLPVPVSNNAVANVQTSEGDYLISFMGLGSEKSHQDVHNQVWALKFGESQWREKQRVPSSLPLPGRLASVAVGIGRYAYVFGGYTVAEDHSEVSSPDNFRYDVIHDSYIKLAGMPVPVDDAVALVYQQRFIYVISGWHNDGNVNLVQVYDINTNTWQQASPFLAAPVFGHAGGIIGRELVVCDGVKVVALPDKRRTFAMQSKCLKGIIDGNNHLKIDWRTLEHPTGEGRYRMASAGVSSSQIAFVGGSNNPYNYNGIGYNGQASQPNDEIWLYDTVSGNWRLAKSAHQSMDHRGLVVLGDAWLTLGGMGQNQQVLNSVLQHNPTFNEEN